MIKIRAVLLSNVVDGAKYFGGATNMRSLLFNNSFFKVSLFALLMTFSALLWLSESE